MSVQEIAKKVMQTETGEWTVVDLEKLQKVVPAPMAEALIKLGKTCSQLDAKLDLVEKDNASIRALFSSESSVPPMERGATYFPRGDPIPSRGSAAENLEGKIWAFSDPNLFKVPMMFTKNTTGSTIEPGQKVYRGAADHRLRHNVEPNNFFWLEL